MGDPGPGGPGSGGGPGSKDGDGDGEGSGEGSGSGEGDGEGEGDGDGAGEGSGAGGGGGAGLTGSGVPSRPKLVVEIGITVPSVVSATGRSLGELPCRRVGGGRPLSSLSTDGDTRGLGATGESVLGWRCVKTEGLEAPWARRLTASNASTTSPAVVRDALATFRGGCPGTGITKMTPRPERRPSRSAGNGWLTVYKDLARRIEPRRPAE